tara:strand:- start:2636 stop:3928 length:1293 start_codon:yes stop_codon:yes gene_type:complete
MPINKKPKPFTSSEKDSNGSKLRIALLGYRSNPYSGGQGIYIRCLAKALFEMGHEVDVISGEPYPELTPGPNLIKLPGLNLFEEPRPFRSFKVSYLFDLTSLFEWASFNSGGFPEPYCFCQRAARFLREFENHYDIVHDNQSLGSGLIKIKNLGIPVISTIHHPITQDLRIKLEQESDWFLRLLATRWHSFLKMQITTARALDNLVSVSQNAKQDIQKDFGIEENKIRVIYNGVDQTVFHTSPEVPKEQNRIISVASADEPLKGAKYLIEAFHLLAKDYPNLRLDFIGSPKSGGTLDKLIDGLGVRNKIDFHSKLSIEKMVALYQRATIAIVPSDYEGFGFPAVEAMACGTPVVSTVGGSLGEIVGDAGLLAPIRDPQALANQARRLLSNVDAQKSYSARGLDRVQKNFTWEKAAARFDSHYKEILVNSL